MDAYLKKYDTFKNIVVYDFRLGNGGIGDYIKFFMYLLMICIDNNLKLYCLKHELLLEKYLILKHNKMYITEKQLTQLNGNFTIKTPFDFYENFSYQIITIPISEVFTFSEQVQINSKFLLPLHVKKYHSIHLRLGDKHLETDQRYIGMKNDTRDYNLAKLDRFIINNSDEHLLFFSDNNSFKQQLKDKFKNIIILNSNIGHTSLENTTDKQVLDTVSELYIMSRSETIIMFSDSGFSLVAAKFNQTPLIKSYGDQDTDYVFLPLINPRIYLVIIFICVCLISYLYKWYH